MMPYPFLCFFCRVSLGAACLLTGTLLVGCELLGLNDTDAADALPAEGLYPVQIDGQWGYVDAEGRLAITPRFDAAEDFRDGRAAVQQGVDWGYIDATGSFVIAPQYRIAGSFADGRAVVRGQDFGAPYRVIDAAGTPLGDGFDLARTFADERLAVRTAEGLWGYADPSGALVISAQFTDARTFSEGLAAVETGTGWAFIDPTGTVVIRPPFAVDAVGDFSDGLAAFATNAGWGYLDRAGTVVIPPRFASAGAFGQGLAAVGLDDHTVAFVDQAGAVVIPGPFEEALPFADDLAAVRIRRRWTYIRRSDGVVAFSRLYDRAEPFTGGIARVYFGRDDDLRVGYIAADGTYRWYPTH